MEACTKIAEHVFNFFSLQHMLRNLQCAATAPTTSLRRLFSATTDFHGLLHVLQSPDSNAIIIDVRERNEIAVTGSVVNTLARFGIDKEQIRYGEITLHQIMEGAFQQTNDTFQANYSFVKPTLTETLIFSCAAGVRSATAQKFAQEAGYTSTLNYVGGSNEWTNL